MPPALAQTQNAELQSAFQVPHPFNLGFSETNLPILDHLGLSKSSHLQQPLGMAGLYDFPEQTPPIPVIALVAVPSQALPPSIPRSDTSNSILLSQAQSLLDQGRTLYNEGRFTEAATAWQQAAQAYSTGGSTIEDQLQEALSFNYLALAFQELNQWQESQQAIEKSLNLLTRLDKNASAAVLAQALNTQAGLFLQLGQTEKALDNWEQAQGLYEQAGDTLGSIGTQINQAQALQSLGFYRRSRQQLDTLNQQLAVLPDSETKISGLRSLGLARQVAGDLQGGQTSLEESLEIAQRLGVRKELSSILLLLGQLSIDQQDPATALTYNASPSQATGGASRGGFGFVPPAGNAAPSQATGGASRSIFAPPAGNSAPSQATGGASRSVFAPPAGNAAPSQATGGASRGVFSPPAGNAAPSQATGGASRGIFTPAFGNAAPSQSTGGASRSVFAPPAGNSAPNQAVGGSARGIFVPPAGNAIPQSAAGGAARTNVYGAYQAPASAPVSMLALTPASFYGTTLSERPSFLVYLPLSGAEQAVFSLKDEKENLIYQMAIPTTGQAEVMVIQLPEQAPALEVNKNYQWYVALKVDGTLSPGTPFVDVWIKRIEPTAEQAAALANGANLEVASQLADQGVWYDSVGMLATLRLDQPVDPSLQSDWSELLGSVGLSDVSDVRLIQTAN
jgi:tetratricopeptide (TPR) repeat protein